jgi:hypothetical protein
MVKSGDQKPGNYTDRYVIEEILPAGHSFIAQQHALRDRHNVTELGYAVAGCGLSPEGVRGAVEC